MLGLEQCKKDSNKNIPQTAYQKKKLKVVVEHAAQSHSFDAPLPPNFSQVSGLSYTIKVIMMRNKQSSRRLEKQIIKKVQQMDKKMK